MGCGATSARQRDETAALRLQVQEQSKQIAQLVAAQHRLCSQLSTLTERVGTQSSFSQSRSGLRAAAAPEVTDDGIVWVPSAIEVIPAIQNYAWGQTWEASLVAQLCETLERPLDRSVRYAEMWMGTHPNGPASVRLQSADGVNNAVNGLKETIASNPEFWLGRDAGRGDLPFLLKVLSVSQALSIQAHPHKKLAEYLHDTFPDRYRDANHKPEICLPLGEFEALVAFRPLEEIRKNIGEVRELQRILGEKVQLSLKDLYARLMRSDPAFISQQVDSLVHRLSRRQEAELTPEERLALRLQKDYPGDVGIFSVFFLNYVRIGADEPNRFIFCAPDEPHAYLYGDCVECMSLSDNVVRAGLTPKFKDVETLLDMMTYRDDRLSNLVGTGEHVRDKVVKYNPPVDDFLVYEVEGGGPSGPLDLPNASICICIKGSFSLDFRRAETQLEEMQRGTVFMCRAGTRLHVLKSDAGSQLFVATY